MAERKGFSLDNYVDVAERITNFYEVYPEGRLTTGSPPQVITIGERNFIWYHGRAWRTPDDPNPGDGWAAEPVPGLTPYTKDSELQNAETAAWGRAIVACGFATKHIASREEVRNRQGAEEEAPVNYEVPDWCRKAAAICKERDIKFRDIPDLKIKPETDQQGVISHLKIWANSIKPKPTNEEALLAEFTKITEGVVGVKDAAA